MDLNEPPKQGQPQEQPEQKQQAQQQQEGQQQHGADAKEPFVVGHKVSYDQLAVGKTMKVKELQALIETYSSERHFRCTTRRHKKKCWINWKCERGGLSQKEFDSRRQSGKRLPKRRAHGSSKAEAILVHNAGVYVVGFWCHVTDMIYTAEKKEDAAETSTRVEEKQNNQRKSRKRVSLKCDCAFHVYAHIMADETCDIRKSVLKHTNGCVPSPTFAAAGERARGFSLDSATIAALKVHYIQVLIAPGGLILRFSGVKDDVVTMKLTYVQVLAKLRKKGFELETRQARNIRYRLIKGLPVGQKDITAKTTESPDADVELDALFNDELAQEIEVGGAASVQNLIHLHLALKRTRPGYIYDVSKDDVGRFTATAWMTGRQRVRAARDGILLFLDSSRSGINSVMPTRCLLFAFGFIVSLDRLDLLFGMLSLRTRSALAERS